MKLGHARRHASSTRATPAATATSMRRRRRSAPAPPHPPSSPSPPPTPQPVVDVAAADAERRRRPRRHRARRRPVASSSGSPARHRRSTTRATADMVDDLRGRLDDRGARRAGRRPRRPEPRPHRRAHRHARPYAIGVILIVAFLLLLVVFRSLVIALFSIVMNLLTVGAAFGFATLVFQHGIGTGLLGIEHQGFVDAWAPLFFFALLFGLSMDYQLFLLAAIRERYEATGDTQPRDRRGHRPHRPADHQRRAHHDRRVHRLRRDRTDPADRARPHPGHGRAARRHRRPGDARAGDDGAARRDATGTCPKWLDAGPPARATSATDGPTSPPPPSRGTHEHRHPATGPGHRGRPPTGPSSASCSPWPAR